MEMSTINQDKADVHAIVGTAPLRTLASSKGVRGFRYDFSKYKGTLYMEDDCCCDTPGCIEFFQMIDANVRRIFTVARRQAGHELQALSMGNGQALVPGPLFATRCDRRCLSPSFPACSSTMSSRTPPV